MTYEEIGIYCKLLSIAWDSGGVVPCDDDAISKLCGLTKKRWLKHKDAVLAAFYFGEDGNWHQKRTEAEYAKAHSLRAIRAEAGRKGGVTKAGFASLLLQQNGSKVSSFATARASDSDSDSSSLSPSSEGELERKPAVICFTPPKNGRARSYEEVRDYVVQHVRLTEKDAKWAWEHCEGNGWTNSGHPICDWKKTFSAWERKKGIFPSQLEKEKKR